jgi:hypothetical protein
MALQSGLGRGLLFEVSLSLLDAWYVSFGRVISSSQRPLPTQDNTTYNTRDKHPFPQRDRTCDPSNQVAKTYDIDRAATGIGFHDVCLDT